MCEDEQDEGEEDQSNAAIQLLRCREGVHNFHHRSLQGTRAAVLTNFTTILFNNHCA